MCDINESISNDNLLQLENTTFNKLVRIQSLLKKESALKKLCKKIIFIS
jgi:hypothetical protein